MARCGCAGDSCSCSIQGGFGVTVSGVGSADRPYVITTSPTYFDEVIEDDGYTYALGSQGVPMGTRTVLSIDFWGELGYIELPDGTSGVAMPPLGSEVEIFVNGTPTGTYGFTGASINWAGTEPTTETRGWYRFVLMWNGIYLGQYIGTD